MSQYFFAWVDPPTSTPVWDNTYKRTDEDIFAYTLQQSEGDFATLSITVRNPKVGLLSASRKYWAWFSRENDAGVTTPLFCGRLVGIPSSVQKEVITLEFVARPVDYATNKAAFADTLRTGEWYDGAFFVGNTNPDDVLNGRPELWHINPVTHAITTSNIVDGEDGTIFINDSQLLSDSFDISIGEPPVNVCEITVSASWGQTGGGSINITNDVLHAFYQVSTASLMDAFGSPLRINSTAGGIALIGAEGMASAWPKYGTNIGGGWSVSYSSLQFVGLTPYGSMITGPAGIENLSADALARFAGTRYPGLFCPTSNGTLFIPIIPVTPHLELAWEVDRRRAEVAVVKLTADTQAILSDDSSEPLLMAITAITDKVLPGESVPPIGNVLSRQYFVTARGKKSLRYAAYVAQAALLAKARCVNITGEVAFDTGISINCRKNISIASERIPSGVAVGKVTEYSMKLTGTGEVISFTIACTVGLDDSLTEEIGVPGYVEATYCTDYQVYYGASEINYNGEILLQTNSLASATVSDDGLDFAHMNPHDMLLSCVVTGGLDTQMEQIATENDALTQQQTGIKYSNKQTKTSSATETRTVLKGINTTVTCTLRTISNSDFATDYGTVTASARIPKMIDLG
jgi:hypothetical protein